MAGTPDDAQLTLPFPSTRGDRARQLAGRVRAVLARVGALVLRWVLRLTLPLATAAAVLQAFPYHATVRGVPFEVQGSLFSRPGLSADTTLGSWEFPTVSGVPFGVHLRPEDVDVLHLTRLAGGNVPGFVERLQADVVGQVPRIAAWLVGEFLLGVLLGLGIAAAINMSVRYLRGQGRRERELRHRARQLAGAVAVLGVVTGYGVVTYNPAWVRESRLTGSLAAAQLFPDQLSQYYDQQNKAFDVLGSVIGIQAALQEQIADDAAPETALQVMVISDMHLAANYPLVAQYAANYGVDLIVNAGDESAFGTRFELTPPYLEAIRAVTATTPMIWLAGNHDSPATVQTMRTVPGVTVLGSKTATADGYRVTADLVQAFGLTIAGLPDPRVYGGPGVYGADDSALTDPLQRAAVAEALGTGPAGEPANTDRAGATPSPPPDGVPAAPDGAPADGTTAGDEPAVDPVDIFATHEPVAAEALRDALPGVIRQTMAGHVHRQNAPGELQGDDGVIDLVEGSTGAGGLDNIWRGVDRPPIEFSIESVGANCEFTRVVRFQIQASDPPLPTTVDTTVAEAYGDDVTASTVYFRPQDLEPGRTCGPQLGIGPVEPWPVSRP
ncbi:metallophosphoesterase family protein [Modestobacter marinus]|uniref:metallophosphoesterase family protein n=1 Tax=Modestobacter marinus TaxID=477641 RepID=UPI001C95AA67|nr:metallophosphoesterase [Modestobacter marinus]